MTGRKKLLRIYFWYRNHLLPIIFNHTISERSPCFNVYRRAIKPSIATKYLGIKIDSKLSLNLHTKTVKSKTVARASHFRKITFKNKLIATKQAWKIYKCICRSLLDYGHPILLNCNNPAKGNIRIAETTDLRRLTKIRHPNDLLYNSSNTLLYDKTQVQPIIERAKMLSTKFARQHCDTMSTLCNTIPPGTCTKHKLPAEPDLQILRGASPVNGVYRSLISSVD